LPKSACSGPGNDYTVTNNYSGTIHQSDGTLLTDVYMLVQREGTLSPVNLKYAVSAGTLSAESGVSDDQGLAVVRWTVTPAQYAGHSEVTFSAGADDQAPVACTPTEVLTVRTNCDIHGCT
jgi:hypothetical protein